MVNDQLVIEAKEPLTAEMIEAGWTLLEAVDGYLQLHAALWFYWSSNNSWRLIVALPEVKAKGTRRIYAQIVTITQESAKAFNTTLALDNLMVIDEQDVLFHTIRKVVLSEISGEGLDTLLLPGGTRHGRYIRDGYVYKFIVPHTSPIDDLAQQRYEAPEESHHYLRDR